MTVRSFEPFRLFNLRLAGESAWVVVGHVAGMGVTLVGVRLLTEWVSPEIYGQRALILSGIALLMSVFVNPICHAFSRFYYEHKKAGTLGSLFFTTAVGLGGVVLVLTAMFVAGAPILPPRMAGIPLGIVLASIALLWTSAVVTLTVSGVLNIGRRRRAAAFWQLLNNLALYGGPLLLLTFLGTSISSVMLGQIAASLVLALALVAVMRKTVREDAASGGGRKAEAGERSPAAWSSGIWWEALAFGYPFIFTSAFGWVSSVSDRYLLAAMVSVEAAGVYTLGYQAGSFILASGAAVFHRIFVPVLYSEDDGTMRKFQDVLGLSFYVFSPVLVAIIIFRAEIIALLAARSYSAAAGIVPLIAAGLFFMSAGQTISQTFLLKHQTHHLVGVTALSAIVNLAANLFLIPRLGMLGAAISTALAYGVYFLAITILSLNLWCWSFPWGSLVRSMGVAGVVGFAVHLGRPYWEVVAPLSAACAVVFFVVYGAVVLAWSGELVRGRRWGTEERRSASPGVEG